MLKLAYEQNIQEATTTSYGGGDTRVPIKKDIRMGLPSYCLFHMPFITIPSRIPSVPKLPENCWGSTIPGSLNKMENRPGGQRFCDCISNIWEYLQTVFSPVAVTPFINTLPSLSTSQLNSPATRINFYVTAHIGTFTVVENISPWTNRWKLSGSSRL